MGDTTYDPNDMNSFLLAQRLKQNNTFGPQGVTSQQPNQPLPTAQDTAPDVPYSYKPQTEITNQYRQTLSQMPERQAYQPGRLQKLAAILAGASGIGSYDVGPSGVGSFHGSDPRVGYAQSQAILNGPYQDAMADWKMKEEALRGGAANEATENVNQRQLVNQQNQFALGERRISETERKNKEDEEIKRERTAIYQMKNSNPNYVFKDDTKTGMVVGIDTKSGQTIQTGIKSGHLSDADKAALGFQYDAALAGVRGNVQVDVDNRTLANDVKRMQARGEVQKDVDANKPIRTGAGTNPGTQIKVNIQQVATDPKYDGKVVFEKSPVGAIIAKPVTSLFMDAEIEAANAELAKEANARIGNVNQRAPQAATPATGGGVKILSITPVKK